MNDVLGGVLLAVGSACCYAVAATLQHGVVSTVAGDGTLTLRRLWAVLSRRRWLLGILCTCCGGALHVFALSRASLVVVQPIGVLAIGLTVLLAVLIGRARLERGTVLAVLVSTAGVGGFVSFAAAGGAGPVVPPSPPAVALLLSGALVLVLALAGRRSRGAVRAPLFACAAGVGYGTVSVLTRSLAANVRATGWTGLTVPSVIGVAVGVVAGIWCVQQAYASGRPDTAVACQTVVDPLVGVLFGGWFYAETARWSAGTIVAEVCCGALAALGVVLLARRHEKHRIPPRTGRENEVTVRS